VQPRRYLRTFRINVLPPFSVLKISNLGLMRFGISSIARNFIEHKVSEMGSISSDEMAKDGNRSTSETSCS
jgi:hypothetical protein